LPQEYELKLAELCRNTVGATKVREESSLLHISQLLTAKFVVKVFIKWKFILIHILMLVTIKKKRCVVTTCISYIATL